MKEQVVAPVASTSRAAALSDSEMVEEMVVQRSSRARTTALGKGKKVQSESESEESDEDGGEGLTRCVCAEDTDELGQALMIQCDTCKCWQHGPCVGLWGEKDCPDRYFCELCRPGWHGPGGILRKAHRKSGASTNPPPPKQARSPSVSASSSSRNKPRESADAALVAAFLAADMSLNPALAHEKLEKLEREKLLNGSTGVDMIEGLAHVLAHRRSASVNSAGPRKSEEHNAEKAPKKRSTMNSRDAAYDDAIAMSILGPGSAAMRARLEQASGGGGDDDEEEDEDLKRHVQETILEQSQRAERSRSRSSAPDDVDAGGKDSTSGDDYTVAPSPPAKKRRRAPPTKESNGHHLDPLLSDAAEDEEMLEHETSREIGEEGREHGDEEEGDLSNLPARTKHPNQYTYRAAKAAARGTRISPAKRQPAHSHKDHAADHPPASKGKAVASASSKEWNNQHHYEPNGWGMPEHLKHLAHFLPSTKPIPIVVPTYSAAQYACQSQDQQSPPPPTTSTVGSHSTLAPHDSAEPILETHFEPPTKIRFPNKRMTMPEMRKRSKHVLEFVGRIQLELQEREKRNEAMKRAVEVGIGAHCSSAQSGLQAGVGSGMALSNGIGGGRAGRGRRWANSSRSSEERVGPREDFNAPDGSVASGSGSANGIVEAEGSQGNFKLIESFSKDVLLFQQRYFGTTD